MEHVPLTMDHYPNDLSLSKLSVKMIEILQCLHSEPYNLLHRDIKPDNILLTLEYAPKFIDFASAKSFKGFDGKHIPQFNQAKGELQAGTPDYCSVSAA